MDQASSDVIAPSGDPFHVPPGWVLVTLRGGPRDGTKCWVKRPERTLYFGDMAVDATAYVRGSGDVWWHPAVPDPEPVEATEQLTLG